jgi:hypothetical protein
MRSTLFLASAILAAVAFTGSAKAEDVPVAYKQLAYNTPQVKSMWSDFLKYEEVRPTAPGGGPAFAWVAEIKAGSDVWTVSQLNDNAWCGMNTCSTRVFKNGAMWLSGRGCDAIEQHVLRPDVPSFVMCEQVAQLRPVAPL